VNLPVAFICWTIALAFLVTTALTLLSLFGFGNPPRFFVFVEGRFKPTLFKVLIVELIALGLSVGSANFLGTKEARAQAEQLRFTNEVLQVRNDVLATDALQNYVAPSPGTTNAQNAAKLQRWMTVNRVTNANLNEFLTAPQFSTERKKALVAVMPRDAVVTIASPDQLKAATHALKYEGRVIETNRAADGKLLLRARRITPP